MKANFIVAGLLGLLMLGCSAAKQEPGPSEAKVEFTTVAKVPPEQAVLELPVNEEPRRPDQLAPGFLLQLSSLDDEKLNGKYRIAADGNLELPYGQSIPAAGLTGAELKAELSRRYRPFFRNAPKIAVKVLAEEYYVGVKGLVNKPGQHLVARRAGLDSLIAAADGLQSGEDSLRPRYARISAGEQTSFVKLDDYYSGAAVFSPDWSGAEEVFFQSQGPEASAGLPVTIQMLGELRRPGEYFYKPGADFFYYLAQAGGPTDRADVEKITLVRRSGDEIQAANFNLKDTGSIPAVQAADIVLIYADNPSPLARKSSILSQIGGVVTSTAMAVILGLGL